MDAKSPDTQKHTPGPWHVERTGRHDSAGRMVVSGNFCLSSVSNLHGNADANARLIASAPELLEACKMMLEDLAEYESPKKGYFKSAEAARAVIAKAEGRHV